MQVLLIEDEEAAYMRLEKMLRTLRPEWTISGILTGVVEAFEWFASHSMPDLIFSDIQLSDGVAFEIYEKVAITCPVIFVTAYDNYAIKAFQLNSIDYLLKPINEEDLNRAIGKFERLQGHDADSKRLLDLAKRYFRERQFENRLISRYGQKIKVIDAADIAYLIRENRTVMLTTREGQHYPLDENLEELEQVLDPSKFFRINRQMIVQFGAIQDIVVYTKSQLKLHLHPETSHETLVSTHRTKEFKEWLKGLN